MKERKRIMILPDMLKVSAERFPQKTAVIYKDRSISYSTFRERARALAGFLCKIGLKKGDRVGLLLEKTPEAVFSFLGVASAGGIVFPIDFNQPIDRIEYILKGTRPFALIVDESFQPLLGILDSRFSDIRVIVVGSKTEERFHTWEEAMDCRGSFRQVPLKEEDPVYLNYTSGTTGLPKGAITTHANLYWNTLASVESLGLTSEDIHLCMFPVFVHPHEIFARPLLLGGTLVLLDTVYPKSILKAIHDHGVTCMMAISSIYETLSRQPEGTASSLSSLKLAESGGMHTTEELARNFLEKYGIPITPVWGSTEATGIALANISGGSLKPASMGKPCRYYEVKIIGENGNELPPGEIGEMILRGPGVCREYFGNPQETGTCIKNGWFHTGDLVWRDPENYFYFADRKARMMKVGGLKVFPSEIEEVLKGHPQIAEVVVLKVEDRLHGEIPKAFVVPKNGAVLDRNDIRKYCKGKLGNYKVPRVVEIRDRLPKTAGGKILWREL